MQSILRYYVKCHSCHRTSNNLELCPTTNTLPGSPGVFLMATAILPVCRLIPQPNIELSSLTTSKGLLQIPHPTPIPLIPRNMPILLAQSAIKHPRPVYPLAPRTHDFAHAVHEAIARLEPDAVVLGDGDGEGGWGGRGGGGTRRIGVLGL